MSEVVLVPGAAHGAWCWHRVVPRLTALGYSVTAVDLPQHGAATVTLADYARAILSPIRDRAVLVGHSAGGVAITAAAEVAPERVAGLLYLCAYVPGPGQSVASLRRAGPSQPLAGTFRLTPDRRAFTFAPDTLDDRFYHDCPTEDRALARAHLTPQPIAPQEEALPATARAKALPRAYIRCTEDRAIPPDWQARMAGGMPMTDLATGHSPFFAAPDQLAALIDRFARQAHAKSGTIGS